MQFLYNKNAGEQELFVFGEDYKYLFKVRRFKLGKSINLRNLKDHFLYRYEVKDISKKEALLNLKSKSKTEDEVLKSLHLIWCMIDNKIVEKTIPVLNQLGLKKLTIVYCQRSQRSFKIDAKRLEKILINSSQQCGRSEMMKVEFLNTLNDVLRRYDDIVVLDFNATDEYSDIQRVLVGCEGGFSDEERRLLSECHKISLKTKLILKSETAAVAICSKLLI